MEDLIEQTIAVEEVKIVDLINIMKAILKRGRDRNEQIPTIDWRNLQSSDRISLGRRSKHHDSILRMVRLMIEVVFEDRLRP